MGMRYREHTDTEDEWSYLWFEKNLQGDIVAIYSPIGIKLASFSYDAWGNFTQTIHNSNAEYIVQKTPFRYRGYYYDSDLGFYVTGTRYYDPAIGRFINADESEYLGANRDLNSYNLYSYCGNNPINKVDPSGHFGLALGIIASCAILGGLIGAFSAVTTGGNVLEGAREGAVTGAIGATCGLVIKGTAAAVIIATAVGAATDIAFQSISQSI